jgi:hypothetical protein
MAELPTDLLTFPEELPKDLSLLDLVIHQQHTLRGPPYLFLQVFRISIAFSPW